jgi:hypothetical protein
MSTRPVSAAPGERPVCRSQERGVRHRELAAAAGDRTVTIAAESTPAAALIVEQVAPKDSREVEIFA